MNERQFKIVQCFLNMGNTAQRISQAFKAPLDQVMLVGNSSNYFQFKEKLDGRGKDYFRDQNNPFSGIF